MSSKSIHSMLSLGKIHPLEQAELLPWSALHWLKHTWGASYVVVCVLHTNVWAVKDITLKSPITTMFLSKFPPEFLRILLYLFIFFSSILVTQTVENLPAKQETWVLSLGYKNSLEDGMATHSCILAWRNPWPEEPGRLQSMATKQRAGNNSATNTHLTYNDSWQLYFLYAYFVNIYLNFI